MILFPDLQNDLDFQNIRNFKPREQLKEMDKFRKNINGKVGILYCLRRTGKTVLLKQWLQNLQYEEQKKAVYILIDSENICQVHHDLRILKENGYKYIAIDEITACEDFTNRAAPLSDNFAKSGMKIFIAGTDSLSLWLAIQDKLFDRAIIFHMTYISFSEWSCIVYKQPLDDYIRYGCLLHLQPTLGEIQHSVPIPWIEDDMASYFNSSIARNIQNSIFNYEVPLMMHNLSNFSLICVV